MEVCKVAMRVWRCCKHLTFCVYFPHSKSNSFLLLCVTMQYVIVCVAYIYSLLQKHVLLLCIRPMDSLVLKSTY